MRRLEADVFNALIAQQDPSEEHPVGTAFIKDCEGPNALLKIQRRYESASRECLRSLNHLSALQGLRMSRAAAPHDLVPLPVPSDLLSPRPPIANAPRPITAAPPPQSLGPRPPKSGFVFDESTPPSWRL